MKTEALYYTVAAALIAVAMGLFLGIRSEVEVGSILGWSAVGALLAMVPLEYRKHYKRLTGRS